MLSRATMPRSRPPSTTGSWLMSWESILSRRLAISSRGLTVWTWSMGVIAWERGGVAGGDRGAALGHHLRSDNPFEGVPESRLGVAGGGRILQDPADEGQP